LQLEIGVRRVAVGRPLPNEIRDCELTLAGKTELCRISCNVGLRVLPIVGMQLKVGEPRAPGIVRADIATGMDVGCAAADTVLVAIGAGEARSITDFSTKLEIRIGRRHPLELQTVVLELPAEKSLIGQRRIVEIPHMLMLVVEIPDGGKEAAELRCESVRQG